MALLPTIKKAFPLKPGYTFMGWYDNPDYTKGIQYYDNNNNPKIVFNQTKDITLYAGWRINTLSIKYSGNTGVWNNPKYNRYNVNNNNMVIYTNTGALLVEKYKYGYQSKQIYM